MADPVRIYTLTETTFDSDLRLPVDKSSFANTKQISWSTLTYDDAVESDQSSNFFNALTPASLLLTKSNTDRFGIAKMANDAEAKQSISTDRVITPSNLPSIFSEYFLPQKFYTTSNIGGYASMDNVVIDDWGELLVGNMVMGNAIFQFDVPSDTKKVTLLMNSTNLPYFNMTGGGNSRVISVDVPEPVSVDISISQSKVLFTFTHAGNGVNFDASNGLYKIKFNYNYITD